MGSVPGNAEYELVLAREANRRNGVYLLLCLARRQAELLEQALHALDDKTSGGEDIEKPFNEAVRLLNEVHQYTKGA